MLSKNRLQSLATKFKQNPELFVSYYSIIQDQLERGIIEHASEEPVAGQYHYLPHRAVVRDDKTTSKIRIVFDASSSSNNSKSLNDCLRILDLP